MNHSISPWNEGALIVNTNEKQTLRQQEYPRLFVEIELATNIGGTFGACLLLLGIDTAVEECLVQRSQSLILSPVLCPAETCLAERGDNALKV